MRAALEGLPLPELRLVQQFAELLIKEQDKERGVNMGTEIDGRIHFWKATLQSNRFLMSPDVIYLLEQTIKDLEELKERQEKDEPAAIKK